MRKRPLILMLCFCLIGAAGYWLARTAVPTPAVDQVAAVERQTAIIKETQPRTRLGNRLPTRRRDDAAIKAGALAGQRSLVFRNRDSLERFLARSGDGVRVIGRLDALNALRVSFSDFRDLAALLDGSEEESMIFPVTLPEDEQVAAQAGAKPLGTGLLSWLGIEGDHSAWGKGVLIAILDTGVVPHPAFSSQIRSMDLVSPGSDPSTWNAHGTAVASVIIGNDPRTPGVAPGASILDVRVADGNGQSNSFTLAQGIIAAADAGAQLINISLGSNGDSGLVSSAVAYAISKGSLVVAASGNNGRDRVSYPAGTEGVISVGGVDAAGQHIAFSNSGKVDIAAPAFGIAVAWPGDLVNSVDGTSFSTPIVVGTIAAAMGQVGSRLTDGAAAWQVVSTHANDAGAPGADPQLGAGLPAMDRVIHAGTAGRYDAAVASHHVIPPTIGTPYPQLQVVVQNRGTETLMNTGVRVTTPAGAIENNITTLRPNSIQTVTVPLSRVSYDSGEPMRFDTTVRLSDGREDLNINNNRRVEIFTPAQVP